MSSTTVLLGLQAQECSLSYMSLCLFTFLRIYDVRVCKRIHALSYDARTVYGLGDEPPCILGVDTNDQLHIPASFNPRERSIGTHWIGCDLHIITNS